MTTGFILILSIASSLLGLFRDGQYGDHADLILRTMVLDGVILVIAVPTLAMGLLYARRGSTRGIIVWLGSLRFMTYVWATATVTIAFNAFFLGYIALFSLSMFTLIGGITSIYLAALVPAKQHASTRTLFAGFLASAAVALTALWLSEIVPATLSNSVPSAIDEFGAPEAVTYVIDLGVVVPSLAVTAMWLRRDRHGAAALAGVLLVFAALLAPAITAITVVDLLAGVTMSAPVIAVSILPPLIGAAFAGVYLYSLKAGAPE